MRIITPDAPHAADPVSDERWIRAFAAYDSL
jgi:hypothetical protein